MKETQMTNFFIEIKSEGVLLNSTVTARQVCKMELKKKQMYLGRFIQYNVVHKPNLGPLSQ